MTNEELVKQIQNNDSSNDYMLELWQQNQGIIKKIVSMYAGYEDIEDLTQQAYMGLYNAVAGYNSCEGVKFMSYAGFWVKQTIRRYIDNCCSPVRVPSEMRRQSHIYKKLQDAVFKEYGREPTDEELCRCMEVSKQTLELIKHSTIFDNMQSLSTPTGEDSEETLLDSITGTQDVERDVINRLHNQELKETLNNMIAELPAEQQEVTRLYYYNNMPMTHIESVTGLKAGSGHNIRVKAIQELSRPHRRAKLRQYKDDYIKSYALKGNGVSRFNRTWTSSTERTALRISNCDVAKVK